MEVSHELTTKSKQRLPVGVTLSTYQPLAPALPQVEKTESVSRRSPVGGEEVIWPAREMTVQQGIMGSLKDLRN